MDRRDLMQLGAVGALAMLTGEAAFTGDAAAANAPVPDNGAKVRVFHVYATPDGESHIDEIEVAANAKPIPLTNMSVSAYHPSKVDWHNVPTPQFAINMGGTLEVEVSSGKKQQIGPGDLVFLEDAKGKGHITRLQGPVSNLFIRVAPGFDLTAWAKGN